MLKTQTNQSFFQSRGKNNVCGYKRDFWVFADTGVVRLAVHEYGKEVTATGGQSGDPEQGLILPGLILALPLLVAWDLGPISCLQGLSIVICKWRWLDGQMCGKLLARG